MYNNNNNNNHWPGSMVNLAVRNVEGLITFLVKTVILLILHEIIKRLNMILFDVVS